MKTAEEIIIKHTGARYWESWDLWKKEAVIKAMEEYRLQSHPSPMSAEQVEDKDLIIQGLQEGAESWKAEYDNCRALLQELVSLKVMKENLYKGNPDGKEYAERKPKAWQAAQQFLSTYQHDASTTPSVKAEGWVSAWQKICIGNNVISVG